MFVIEQIGHERVGRSYWSVLETSSVGCDPLVALHGEELITKRDRSADGKRYGERKKRGARGGGGKGGSENKKTHVVGIWIVWAPSPFELSPVGG